MRTRRSARNNTTATASDGSHGGGGGGGGLLAEKTNVLSREGEEEEEEVELKRVGAERVRGRPRATKGKRGRQKEKDNKGGQSKEETSENENDPPPVTSSSSSSTCSSSSCTTSGRGHEEQVLQVAEAALDALLASQTHSRKRDGGTRDVAATCERLLEQLSCWNETKAKEKKEENGAGGRVRGEERGGVGLDSATQEVLTQFVSKTHMYSDKIPDAGAQLLCWRAACAALDELGSSEDESSFFRIHPLHFVADRYQFLLKFHKRNEKTRCTEQAWKVVETACGSIEEGKGEEVIGVLLKRLRIKGSATGQAVVCSFLHILSWFYSKEEGNGREEEQKKSTCTMNQIIYYCASVPEWIKVLPAEERSKHSTSLRKFSCKLLQSMLDARNVPSSLQKEQVGRLLLCILRTSLTTKDRLQIPTLLAYMCKALSRGKALQLYETAVETYYGMHEGNTAALDSSRTSILIKCVAEYAKVCKLDGREASSSKLMKDLAGLCENDALKRALKVVLLLSSITKLGGGSFEYIRECEEEAKSLADLEDNSALSSIWGAVILGIDGLRCRLLQRGHHGSQSCCSTLVAGNESEACAAASLMEASLCNMESLYKSGVDENSLKRHYAATATSLVSACKIRVSWVVKNPRGEESHADFDLMKEFLTLSHRIGSKHIGEQVLWLAKSLYNLGIEVSSRGHKSIASLFFGYSFLALSILFNSCESSLSLQGQLWKIKSEEETLFGNHLSDLLSLGIKISDGSLKCGKASDWAHMIRSMSCLLAQSPSHISRIVKGAHESRSCVERDSKSRMYAVLFQTLLKEGEDLDISVLIVDKILLSDAHPSDGMLTELLAVLVPLIPGGGSHPFKELKHLRILVQIAFITKQLVLCGKHANSYEYAKNCVAFVLELRKALEVSHHYFEEAIILREKLVCDKLLAWMNYNLSAMVKHLHQFSERIAEVEPWSVFAMQSVMHWEEYLNGINELEGVGDVRWFRREGEMHSMTAMTHLCNEAVYDGNIEVLDRGNGLLKQWVSHFGSHIEDESVEAAHLYLGQAAYHFLLTAYSQQIHPKNLLGFVQDFNEFQNNVSGSLDLNSLVSKILSIEDSRALMLEARKANEELRNQKSGRLLRALLQLLIAAKSHKNNQFGLALAHAVEANRIMQGTIKTCLDTRSATFVEKALIRNLHLFSLLYIGDLRCVCGAPEDASRAYHEVLHHAGSDMNPYFVGVASVRMGKAYFMRCESEKAEVHANNARESLKILREDGASDLPFNILEMDIGASCASLSVFMEDYDSAAVHLRECLQLSSSISRFRSEEGRTNCAPRSVLRSQLMAACVGAKLQMAELLLLKKKKKEAKEMLDSCFESMHLGGHSDYKSKYLFISAIARVFYHNHGNSDICSMRSQKDLEEGIASAVCRLQFDDRPQQGSEEEIRDEVPEILLEAYRESKGDPLLSYKVAQLLSLLFTPAEPLNASTFLHASIGISYHLQSTYLTRTSFLRDHFCKGKGGLPDIRNEDTSEIFGSCLQAKLQELRGGASHSTRTFEMVPKQVAVCSVSVVLPADVLCVTRKPVLTLTRTLQNKNCVAVKLPLEKGANADGRTFLCDFSSILSRSNESMKQEWDFNDKKQMRAWWKMRLKLDHELNHLMEQVNDEVLGPFAVFLLGEATSNIDLLVSRVSSLCSGLKLTKAAVQMLALVLLYARKFKEEEICEQIKTVLGGFSFKRQVEVGEIESLSEKFKSEGSSLPPLQAFKPGPVLLVLDGRCQPFPWESLPCFKSQEFYRVPSLSYIHRARLRARERPSEVDWENASFLLNPSGDLTSTQTCFESWFAEQEGWSGISGEAPDTSALLEMLSLKDIFLYFGHGTCEQYISKSTMEKLKSCSAVFLMGCSSAKLSKNYMNQGRGFLLSYLLAGSPLAIGNLWDVTDKDIDRFAKCLLENCLGEGQGQELKDDDDDDDDDDDVKDHTLSSRSIMQARQACKLPALTGFSPVYYGIPPCVANEWRRRQAS